LVPITLALAVSFVFSGLTVQHRALLRRAMQFHKLTAVQVVATAMGHVTAVVMAWQMRSYWALVARPIVTAVLLAAGTWLMCRWRPGLPRRGTGVRQMAYFGFNLAGFNLINYLARNVDYLLIGWRWGPTPLGYYERAYRLLMFPLQQVNLPMSTVGIPALSRLQNEPAKYVQAYETIIGKLIYVAGTVVGFLIVTSDAVIRIVFGEQWLPSIPIFQWLAIVAVRQVYANTTGWLFISQGRTREMLWWGCIGTAIAVGSFGVGLPYGPEGVAMAYAIIPTFIAAPIQFWMLGRRGPMSTWYLWKLYLFALHVPLVVAAVTFGANWVLEPDSPLMTLIMLGPVAGATALILMASTPFGRRQVHEALDMLRHVRVQKKANASES
jgi:PST family polysaccharide transporter